MERSFLRTVCLWLSGLATLGGGAGFIGRGLAFLNQSRAELRDADATAWVAVAVLFGAGLVSLTILAGKKP